MRLTILSNHAIEEIVNSISTDDKEVKEMLKSVIVDYNGSYVDFVFNIFNFCLRYYYSIVDENSWLDIKDIFAIYDKLRAKNIRPELNNILMCSVYDVLYTLSEFPRDKFKVDFYEDIYKRLESLYGAEIAYKRYDEVFWYIEELADIFERIVLFHAIKSDRADYNTFLYTEIKNNYLFIYSF